MPTHRVLCEGRALTHRRITAVLGCFDLGGRDFLSYRNSQVSVQFAFMRGFDVDARIIHDPLLNSSESRPVEKDVMGTPYAKPPGLMVIGQIK